MLLDVQFGFAGTYTIDICSFGNSFIRCADISRDNGKDAERLEKIITCSDRGYSFGRKVIISSFDEKHLKIYELNIIGVTKLMLYIILCLLLTLYGTHFNHQYYLT